MWSDNDIDNAFQRLTPPEPEPASFPLDAWLRLETQLDKAVIEGEVRRKLWRYFAAEVAVVALVALGWLLWPAGAPARLATPTLAGNVAGPGRAVLAPAARVAGAPLGATTSAAIATGATITAAALAAGVALQPVSAAGPAGHEAASAVPKALAAANRSGHFSRNTQRVEGFVAHPPLAGPLAGSRLAQPVPMAKASATEASVAASVATTSASAATPTTATTSASRAASASLGAARQSSYARRAARFSAHKPTAGRVMDDGGRPASYVRDKAPAGTLHAAGTRQPQASAKVKGQVATATNAAVAHVTGNQALETAVATAHSDAAALAGAGPLDELSPVPAATALLLAPAAPEQLAPAAIAAIAEGPRPVRQFRFHVGVVAAPDVSTVKFDGLGPPCLNLGLALDFRLSNRLRLSTGLLRANKQYVARREDYDWGDYQARVYSHDFKDVKSVCTVLDVPLNLRYDLLVRPTYRLVGTAGLSSLFMQRESYNYDWTDATGLHTWTGSAVNQNRHLFSVLNLAAGVEYGLGTRWDLLAEPYVKVPLGGVGLGKVKLLSAGVLFGLKYGF